MKKFVETKKSILGEINEKNKANSKIRFSLL